MWKMVEPMVQSPVQSPSESDVVLQMYQCELIFGDAR
jgi:hypothetical protein